jgi:hypothetical protein
MMFMLRMKNQWLAMVVAATGLCASAQAATFTFTPPGSADLNDLDHNKFAMWAINDPSLSALLQDNNNYKITSATLKINNIYDWTREANDILYMRLLNDPSYNTVTTMATSTRIQTRTKQNGIWSSWSSGPWSGFGTPVVDPNNSSSQNSGVFYFIDNEGGGDNTRFFDDAPNGLVVSTKTTFPANTLSSVTTSGDGKTQTRTETDYRKVVTVNGTASASELLTTWTDQYDLGTKILNTKPAKPNDPFINPAGYVNPDAYKDFVYSFSSENLNWLSSYALNGLFGLAFDADCHYYNDGVSLTIQVDEIPHNPPVPDAGSCVWMLGCATAVLAGLRRKWLA